MLNFNIKNRKLIVCLLAAIITLIATYPLVGAGLPYFYEEDEGHHFNRTVEMAKTGDLDPHYFHKPSLHFYLRLPAVYMAYQILKWRGEVSSLKDIKTRDRFGLAEYSFTASHILIAKACRFVSLLLTIGVVCFTILICFELKISPLWALLSGLIVVASPEVFKNSTIVGVDVLMAFTVLATTYFALLYFKSASLLAIILSALFSGLAVSSKYNAAPIVCIPFLAVLIGKQKTIPRFALSAILPFIGFVIGSPYFLLSLDLVKKHVGYEYDHYRTLGHEGHSAEPGLDQALFYANWLISDGVGLYAAILALLGLFLIIKNQKKLAFIFLAFPALYMSLMIAQKTNFTRNMVVIVPFVAILAAQCLNYITDLLKRSKPLQLASSIALVAFIIYTPARKSLALENATVRRPETRKLIYPSLDKYQSQNKNIFVAGEFWLPKKVYDRPGITVGDSSKANLIDLSQRGIDVFILPGSRKFSHGEGEFLNFDLSLPGKSEEQRIVNNPTINFFSVKLDNLWPLLHQLKTLPEITLKVNRDKEQPEACASSTEEHCWLSNRANSVKLEIPKGSLCGQKCFLTLNAMTPWKQQKVHVTLGSINKTFSLDDSQTGNWQQLKIELPGWPIENQLDLKVYLDRVASPAIWQISPDERMLGLALKNVTIQDR